MILLDEYESPVGVLSLASDGQPDLAPAKRAKRVMELS